jgi:hypothetical protein
MASSLQEQLQRLAAAAGIASGKGPRGKPSLLYTFQEAADVGVQDIYAIAVQGKNQLLFLHCKSMFSASSTKLNYFCLF